jgi:hypothetical protein
VVARESFIDGNMREELHAHPYFTDDHAPVEQLIDLIIFNAVENNQEQ